MTEIDLTTNFLSVYMGGFVLSVALYSNHIYSFIIAQTEYQKQFWESFSPDTKRALDELSTNKNAVNFVVFTAAMLVSIIWPITLPLLLLEMATS